MSTSEGQNGYISPTHPNPMGPHDARIIIYGYVPSFALCILAITLFTLACLLHLFQSLRYKTYYFLPLTFACLLETIGYVFRSLSAKRDPYNIIDFVVQYFCIVTAPVFISASIYVCLSRLITWAEGEGFLSTGQKQRVRRFLNPKAILYTFITADILCTIIQITGAALTGSAESNHRSPTTPNNILLSGLVIQTFFFTLFLVLLCTFYHTVLPSSSPGPPAVRAKIPFFVALLGASLLVYLRTIFRLAETSQGVFGNLSTHEGYFAGLEFAPVVVAVAGLGGWHPGRWITGRVVRGGEGGGGEGEGEGEGVTEVEGKG
ncbi:phospholipid-translocating ATPase rsb1 [Lecanora helva]